jgi:hypothetical protein
MTESGLLSIAERAAYGSSRDSDWVDGHAVGGRLELFRLRNDFSSLIGGSSSVISIHKFQSNHS